ncbi:TPA: protealysin inhibitor emfourin [Citrobacter freundii]
MDIPELTDDAVVELAREGGVAFIPKLNKQRKITLGNLSEAQRQRIADILRQSLSVGTPPGRQDSPGRGDQRYFRIQIIWTARHQARFTDIIVLVPENEAPASLIELWQKGADCVCD